MIFIGALCGRFVCGWLCPFGLVAGSAVSDTVFSKEEKTAGDSWLKYLKYVVLVLFVIILPLTVLDVAGQGQPWFCKLLCPSGMLMGALPLLAVNEPLRSAVGWLFTWKAVLLILIVLLALWVYRPFCRYLCPLGAVLWML